MESINYSTESKKHILIKAPQGVRFTSLPTIAVMSGNLTLKSEAMLLSGNTELFIPIDTNSTRLSTIGITNINVTIDSTFQIEKGMKFAISAGFEETAIADYAKNPESLFYIGSNVCVINGVKMVTGAKPYIRNGVTFLPLHYAALASDFKENEIVISKDKQTITLSRENRDIVVKIGNMVLEIDNSKIVMDVAAEIDSSSGCVMLPIRWASIIFGCNIDWDPERQTITIW